MPPAPLPQLLESLADRCDGLASLFNVRVEQALEQLPVDRLQREPVPCAVLYLKLGPRFPLVALRAIVPLHSPALFDDALQSLQRALFVLYNSR